MKSALQKSMGADIGQLVRGTGMKVKAEHSLTPDTLINELKGFERFFFKTLFAGKTAGRIYRLYELETAYGN